MILIGIVAGAALMLSVLLLFVMGHLNNKLVDLEKRMDAMGRASLEQAAGVSRVEKVADQMLSQIQALAKREGPTRSR